MSFRYGEKPASRRSTVVPPTEERNYWAAGERNHETVKAFMTALTPALVMTAQGILYRQDLKLTETAAGFYDVTVPYEQQEQQTGSYSLSFDTTGGTITRKVSDGTRAYRKSGDPIAPKNNRHDHLIGVNVSGDSVDGCEQVIPALKINVAFRHPLAVVTQPYIKALARNTGKVNSDSFLGFEAGEVLFLGASGSEGTSAETEVNYQFAMSENVTDQTIGSVTGITKKGHEYLWVTYKDAVSDGVSAKEVEEVFVEKIYRTTDLAALLGFGA